MLILLSYYIKIFKLIFTNRLHVEIKIKQLFYTLGVIFNVIFEFKFQWTFSNRYIHAAKQQLHFIVNDNILRWLKGYAMVKQKIHM